MKSNTCIVNQKTKETYQTFSYRYSKHPNRKVLASNDNCGKTILSDKVICAKCYSGCTRVLKLPRFLDNSLTVAIFIIFSRNMVQELMKQSMLILENFHGRQE